MQEQMKSMETRMEKQMSGVAKQMEEVQAEMKKLLEQIVSNTTGNRWCFSQLTGINPVVRNAPP